jgi:hypothetical protein
VSLNHAQGEKTATELCGDLHTQAEMNDCAAAEAKKADAELNAAYCAKIIGPRQHNSHIARLWSTVSNLEENAQCRNAQCVNPKPSNGRQV